VAVDRLWVEPEDGLEPVLGQLSSARSSLDIVVYLLTHPDVVDRLIAAHERGVRVRVMVEEEPYGGGAGNASALKRLSAAGVEWRYGNPTFRYTHEKAVVIDRKRALVMTANLTKSAFARNREYIALLSSPPEVREIQSIFDADWDRRGYTPRAASLVVSDTNSRERLLGLIGGARESLDVEAEVMADREVRAALIAAHKRGVRVRIVMSPPEREETTYEGLSELSRAGVGVRLISSPYMHAKLVVADRQRAYVGSVNFTATSMDQNRELGILTSTPTVLRRLQGTFDGDWRAGEPFAAGR
jgi:phosphatidylserine/phosphatidylglycerophosphate/cardiolipin synthase-like enzyme